MKNTIRTRSLTFVVGTKRQTLVCLFIMAALSFGQPAQAANEDWKANPTNANWSTGSNWSGGAAPGNTSSGTTATANVASFVSAVGGSGFGGSLHPIVIDSGRTIGGITFEANAGAFVIGTTGGNTLYLSSGGLIQNLEMTSNIETINAPVEIYGSSATATFTSRSLTLADVVNFGGEITASSGNAVLTLAGSNTGANTISGDIENGGATSLGITKVGMGTWVLSGDNTYTGATTVSMGTLQAGSTTGFSANSVFTANGTLDLNGFGNTILSLSGSGLVTNSTGNEILKINGQHSAGATTFSGDITDGGGGAGSTLNIRLEEGTDLTLSGDNTYVGATLVTPSSTLLAGSTTAFSANSAFTVNGSLDLNGYDNTTLSLSGSGLVINNGGANAILTVDDTNSSPSPTTYTYAGLITDGTTNTLGLIKAGPGALTLTDANSFSGGTTINGGTLVVGNPTALGIVGALGGTGNVTNNATLETTASSPLATAPLAIMVAGAYSQTTGTLLLQVATDQGPAPTTSAVAGTDYDTLAATGTAAINGGAIDLNFEGGVASHAGQRFQVVSSAAGPVTPTPGIVSVTLTGTPFLGITTYNDSFGGTYAANNVVVTLFQAFTTFAGLTPNQTNVAGNIDANVIILNNNGSLVIPTGAAADFFNNIVTGLATAANAGNLGPALDQLSPQRFEILHNVAFDNYAFDVQSLDQEFARERMGVGGVDTAGFTFTNSELGPELSQVQSRLLAWSPAPEPGLLSDSSQAVLGGVKMVDKKDMKEMTPATPEQLFSVFIDGGVDLGDKDSNDDESHSSYTTGRVRVGADYRVCKDVRVGMLFGYNHTDADLDNEGSKARVDGYTPGVFLTYADKDGFYANALFTYTANEYSTDRDIVIPGVNRTANGSSSGDQFGGDLDGGYDFHRGDWTFGPSAGLTYVNLGIDSFTESGAGAADLAVNSQSAESLRSRLGGTVSYRTEVGSVVLTPYASAYWQHEFLDDGTNITSAFEGLPGGTFSVQTTNGDSDNALLGAGLNAELNQTLTLFVDYGAEAGGSSFFGQSATGGVKVAF